MGLFLFKLFILALGIWVGWDLHQWFLKREVNNDSACIALYNALIKRINAICEGKETPYKADGFVSVIIKREEEPEITDELVECICVLLPEIKQYILGKIRLCDLVVCAVNKELYTDENIIVCITLISQIVADKEAVEYILKRVPDTKQEGKGNASIHRRNNEKNV